MAAFLRGKNQKPHCHDLFDASPKKKFYQAASHLINQIKPTLVYYSYPLAVPVRFNAEP